MCQRPRKQKKTCSTQVCYLLVPQSCQIQPSVSPKLLSRYLRNLYIFCLTYTPLHISNLKEIASAVLEMVPQSCQIQPSVSPKLLSRYLRNLYIFCLTYTPLHISNLKEIASAVLEIFVPKNCPIFFTFFFFFAQNYKYI